MAATLGPRLHTLRYLLALDHSHRTQPRYFARQSRPVDHVNDFVDVLICLWNFFHDSLAGFAAHDDSLLFEFPFNLLCVASFGGRGAAEQTACAMADAAERFLHRAFRACQLPVGTRYVVALHRAIHLGDVVRANLMTEASRSGMNQNDDLPGRPIAAAADGSCSFSTN